MKGMDQEGDSEYDYEYDENETESFLVDLDISSLNGVIKSRTPGFRRNLQRPSRRNDETPSKKNARADDDDEDADEVPTDSPIPPQSRPSVVGSNIQVLDLHTPNPLISFQDHIYSCTWSDMLGTNLFFSTHERRPMFEPQSSNQQYDLLGTSRIKLLGHRAKVTQKPGTKKRGRPPNDKGQGDDLGSVIDENELLQPGKSLGNLHFNNAKVNADIRRQARFLEKFMDAKRARGDTDIVRTVITKQSVIASNKARRLEKETSAQMSRHHEIERLNRRVVRGDSEALVRLQEIYSGLEDEEENEAEATPSAG